MVKAKPCVLCCYMQSLPFLEPNRKADADTSLVLLLYTSLCTDAIYTLHTDCTAGQSGRGRRGSLIAENMLICRIFSTPPSSQTRSGDCA